MIKLSKKERHAPPHARSMLDIHDVRARTRRSKTWIYEASADGRFPAPVRLSSRCTRWDSLAVDAWIARQFEEAKK